jgi:hypothetical protein
MQLEYTQHIFKKMLKFQIWSKQVQREQSCSVRTDWHEEDNNHYSQFCERAESVVMCP